MQLNVSSNIFNSNENVDVVSDEHVEIDRVWLN